jgi:4-carboxymuconolactone decarboxylase
MSGGEALTPGLRALVRLSAAVAGGADRDLGPFLQEAVNVAEAGEVEEVLVQSYLFLGYPAALNALAEWRRVSGRPAPPPAEPDMGDWPERGTSVCRRVYGGAYEDLRRNIARLSPDMDRWMVEEGYGKVLGRPGLSLSRRECCIAAMLTVLGTAPQLRSHLRGALRTGASPELVDRMLEEIMPLVPAHRWARATATWNEVRTRWGNT